MQSPVVQAPELWRLETVKAKTGLSKSQIYALEKERKFVRRVQISERISGWPSDEVQAWINEKIASRVTQKEKRVAVKKSSTQAAA